MPLLCRCTADFPRFFFSGFTFVADAPRGRPLSADELRPALQPLGVHDEPALATWVDVRPGGGYGYKQGWTGELFKIEHDRGFRNKTHDIARICFGCAYHAELQQYTPRRFLSVAH